MQFIVPTARSRYRAGAGGALTLLLLLFAAFVRVADSQTRRIVRACAISGAVCLLLMLPLSTPLWEMLPLLKFTQFPWRFMGPLAVVLAAATGVAARDLRFAQPTAFAILLAALLNAGPMLLAYRPIDAEPLLTPDTIREHNLRATVLDEYLPRHRDALLEEPRVRALGKAVSAIAVAALLAAALIQRRRVKTAA